MPEQTPPYRQLIKRLFPVRSLRRQHNAHGQPVGLMHGHGGCVDGGDLGPCDCLCHRDSS